MEVGNLGLYLAFFMKVMINSQQAYYCKVGLLALVCGLMSFTGSSEWVLCLC